MTIETSLAGLTAATTALTASVIFKKTALDAAVTAASEFANSAAASALVAGGADGTGGIGEPGPAGATGDTGAQGIQGIAGTAGGVGPAGPTGGIGAQGPNGTDGGAGPAGIQGIQGVPGQAGVLGQRGEAGNDGVDGTSVSLKGSVSLLSNLPTDDNTPGDLWVVTANGNGYVWDGEDWISVGPIQGPAGSKGDTGSDGAIGLNGADGSPGADGAEGTAGTAGPAGSTGTTGANGSTGAAGPAGPQGIQGIQGNNGIGTAGPQGIQGIQGNNGLTGTTGSQGIQGTTGDAGDAGETGIIGLTGIQGEQGIQGEIGVDGQTGADGTSVSLKGSVSLLGNLPTDDNTPGDLWVVTANGNGYVWDGEAWISVGPIQGPTGEKGDTGTKGDTGAASNVSGPQGVQGVQGITGADGVQGIQGTTGDTGAIGDDGPIGARGDAGNPGVQGIQGQQGAAGAVGADGVSGPTGLQGAAGGDGVSGPAGPAGGTGAQGNQGEQGIQGETGVAGGTGLRGEQGEQGDAGAAGLQGIQGETGSFGGASFYYTFETDTYEDIVPAGYIRLDNTDATLATVIAIADTDRFNTNIAAFIQTVDDSTSDIKGYVKLTEEGNLANFITFAITSEHYIHDDHFHIPVSYVSGALATSLSNVNYIVSFIVSGDKGDRGVAGTPGVDGTNGTDGTQGIQGVTGSPGVQGIQGIQGITGNEGQPGVSGTPGIQGSAGIQGLTGPTGATGTVDVSLLNDEITRALGAEALLAPKTNPIFTGTVSGVTAAMTGAPSGSGTSTGVNTGDQTSITGNAGSATNLTGGDAGQIIYQSAVGVTSTLPNGTASQVLQSNGGTEAPSWVTPATGGGGSSVYYEVARVTPSESTAASAAADIDNTAIIAEVDGIYRTTFNAQFAATPGLVAAQCEADLTSLIAQINALSGFGAHGAAYGTGETLLPGRYYIAGATTHTGNLNFDAQGDPDAMWIMKCGAAHAIAAAATATLLNGAKASNIFWYIVGAPTIGASCKLKGTYIGMSAIAPGDVFDLEGRILTQTGAITTSNTTYTTPVGDPPVLNLGILKSFVFFTPAGAISNTVIKGGVGDVATGGGAVTGFGTINGTVYLPTDVNTKVSFGIYADDVLIPASIMYTESRLFSGFLSVATAGQAEVSAGQTISAKMQVNVGSVVVANRTLYATKIA